MLCGCGKGRASEARLKADTSQASLPPATPPYPVQFTCREDNGFHPSSGYHEGLFFEVFNESDKPVTVKGFGLEITLRTQAEWHEYDTSPPFAAVHLSGSGPQPNDGLDGHINTEWLADEIWARGESDYVVNWRPYVELAGYGVKTVDIEKESTYRPAE